MHMFTTRTSAHLQCKVYLNANRHTNIYIYSDSAMHVYTRT